MNGGEAGKLRPWWWGALVVACLVLFLPGFFTLPPFDRDEARFAQAARQMVVSGDFVDIRFQKEERLKKPVGIYWLESASVSLFGDPESSTIWPYRLPSLLGAVVAVLATAWAGARLFGPAVGVLAALMLAGCVLLGVEARMAKTDAALLGLIVVAQGALARIWLERDEPGPPGWTAPLVFWLAIGAGILVKGPIGPMVSGLTIFALALTERRFDWIKRLRPLVGIALATMMAAPWLVAISLKTGGRFLSESVGHDLADKIVAGQESKGSPPGPFFLTVWLTFAPFALPAALAAPWVWRHRREPAVMFCLAWLLPSWLVFEGAATKLLHYVLPTFPAIALLTARAAADGFAPRQRWLFFGVAIPAGLALLALAGGTELLPWFLDHQLPVAAVVAAVVLSLSFAVGVVMLWQGRVMPGFAALLAGAAVWSGLTFGLVLPGSEGLWLSRQVAERVAVLRPCPASDLASGGYTEPSLVFLLGTRTRLGGGETAAGELRADPACGLALVESSAEPAFRESLGGLAVKPLATIEGFNYSRGQRQTLTLYAAVR